MKKMRKKREVSKAKRHSAIVAGLLVVIMIATGTFAWQL
jgi:hypothetical protein